MCLTALALAAAAWVAPVHAQSGPPLRGIDLARACRAEAGEEAALCRGFLDGFTFGSQQAVGPEFIGEWRYGAATWCFPRAIDAGALKAALLDYAQANTGVLHFPAAVVAANAFSRKFPCK
jgi:hypothetical protein